MDYLTHFKQYLEHEIDGLSHKADLNINDLEILNMLLNSLKNICKLIMIYEASDVIEDKKSSTAVRTVEHEDASEFTRLALNAAQGDLINILDEHMETIKALYPKEYSHIIEKLSNS